MPEPDDPERRVSVLVELRGFRRATTASFTAMRADLADLRHETRLGFAAVQDQFAEVYDRFAEIRGRLDVTAAGLNQITVLLNTLIERDAG